MLRKTRSVTIQHSNRGVKIPAFIIKVTFIEKMILYLLKKTVMEVGRQRTGVCSLFMGNPLFSMVSSFVPLLLVKILKFY